MGIPEIPAQDFSKFGPVETKALPRIKKLSGPFLHRSWLNVPHVTHNDEADITDLDSLPQGARHRGQGRRTLPGHAAGVPGEGVRVGLEAVPRVQQLAVAGEGRLILKKLLQHRHRGRHPRRPGGPGRQGRRPQGHRRAVPGVRGDLRKGPRRQAGPGDMQGGTFTISSLGGIGGTSFTPIVNAPEVAILGVVRSKMTPVWNGTEFIPRLMLPLSLSYDHRVIDGALAARFTRHLCHLLEDDRRLDPLADEETTMSAASRSRSLTSATSPTSR